MEIDIKEVKNDDFLQVTYMYGVKELIKILTIYKNKGT